MRALLESSFEPGWNQFASYDDENLRRTRVRYRARHALEAQVGWVREQDDFSASCGVPGEEHRLDMFLGNAYATP